MPAANLSDLGLSDKSPGDLEKLRQEIVADLRTKYKGYDDPDVPEDVLNRLAVITSSLRRKNAGPPKPEKKTKSSVPQVKATLDDFA